MFVIGVHQRAPSVALQCDFVRLYKRPQVDLHDGFGRRLRVEGVAKAVTTDSDPYVTYGLTSDITSPYYIISSHFLFIDLAFPPFFLPIHPLRPGSSSTPPQPVHPPLPSPHTRSFQLK